MQLVPCSREGIPVVAVLEAFEISTVKILNLFLLSFFFFFFNSQISFQYSSLPPISESVQLSGLLEVTCASQKETRAACKSRLYLLPR